MTAYTATLNCPQCGGDVDPVTESRPSDLCTRLVAVTHCRHCRRRWDLITTLRPHTKDTP